MKEDPYVQARLAEVKILDELVWERRCPPAAVKAFLECISEPSLLEEVGLDEATAKRCGSYLASRCHYFGSEEVRDLLKCVFRNLYVPYCQRGGARAATDLDRCISQTRFLGIGSPAKSGAHLLYPFRQVNRLKESLFPPFQGLFEFPSSGGVLLSESSEEVSQLVFIDDFAGTGKQAARHLKRDQSLLEAFVAAGGVVRLFLLIATRDALESLRRLEFLETVDAVLELDDSYAAFGGSSRYFEAEDGCGFRKEDAYSLFERAGSRLVRQPERRLGFGDGQLLVAMHHNTPNNSLPPLWSSRDGWSPLFQRHEPPLWGRGA